MNWRQHAMYSRDLIHACGGLNEVERENVCRLSRSRVADFMIPSDQRSPNKQGAMPADVIHDLEAYCGVPIYSRALAACRPQAPGGMDLINEACDTVGAAAKLLDIARTALADGKLTNQEKNVLLAAVARIEEEVAQVKAAAEAVTT